MSNSNIIEHSSSYSLMNFLKNTAPMKELQFRLDQAEKYGEKKFADFSDPEMITWFLHERRHLNPDNERSARTIREYEIELQQFVEYLLQYNQEIGVDVEYIVEGSLFKSLQSRHLRRYMEWLETDSPYAQRNGRYSPATLSRKTSVLKNFFTFLYTKGYISEPIQEGFYISKVKKDDRPDRDLGPSEVVALLDGFKASGHTIMFAIVHILATTGMRNEEFCTLTVGSLKKDTLRGGYYLDIVGKGNKHRQIPIREKVLQSIHDFREARGLAPVQVAASTDPLFTTGTGRAFSVSYFTQYVSKQLAIAVKSNPELTNTVKLTPHVFRHAFAIISKQNNVDIYDIMRSLGHDNIETTMIYLDKIFARERHAIHSWQANVLGGYI